MSESFMLTFTVKDCNTKNMNSHFIKVFLRVKRNLHFVSTCQSFRGSHLILFLLLFIHLAHAFRREVYESAANDNLVLLDCDASFPSDIMHLDLHPIIAYIQISRLKVSQTCLYSYKTTKVAGGIAYALCPSIESLWHHVNFYMFCHVSLALWLHRHDTWF